MLAGRSTQSLPYWPGSGGGDPAPDLRLSTESLLRTEKEATRRWLGAREQGKLGAATRRTRSALARRFDRLNAPVVYPWSPSVSGTAPAHQLHRRAASLLRRRSVGGLSLLWLAIKAVLWPALAFPATIVMVGRCGRDVRRRHGLTLRKQWRDVVEAALGHGIFPTEYYHRRVFAGDARVDKALYLNEREMIALLSAADFGADTGQVDDLARFYACCRQRGLPIPRTLAEFPRGRRESDGFGGALRLPEKDLFVRPARPWVDARGEHWRWNHRNQAWQHGRLSLGSAAFIQHLRRASCNRPCLLQEAILNHPEAGRFSPGPLCSYRVATGVDGSGRGEILFASFVCPGADLAGENEVAIDLESGVDLTSGRLLPAVGEFIADGEFDAHPATGTIITGAAAPHWPAVCDLARKAHARFSDIPFVGWQIAVGAGGPVLLEASTNWGFFAHVLPAATRFADLCLEHLDRRGAGAAGRSRLA